MPNDHLEFVVVLRDCEMTLRADDYTIEDDNFVFTVIDDAGEEVTVALVTKKHCQGIFLKSMLIEDDEEGFPKPFNEDEDDDKEF